MENSDSKRSATFIVEIIDKFAQIFLEMITKVNLNKIGVTGSSLINLLLVTLVMLSLAMTSWWGVLALLFIALQTLSLPSSNIVLILLTLNLTALLVSVMLFFSFKKKLQFLNI